MYGKMNRMKQIFKVAFLAVTTIPLTLVSGQAADYFRSSPAVVVDAGICSQQSVLRRVVANFSYQVRHVPELPQVGISAMSDVQLTRYEPKTNPAEIERTYCKATAVLSDGQYRPVWYMVEDAQGFAGVGKNVEFCVDGFDRWHVYDANCRVLR